MKKLFLAIIAAFAISNSFAQTNSFPWPSSGNVGIGTTSPASLLTLNSTNITDLLLNRSASKYARVLFSTAGVVKWYIGLDNDVSPNTQTFVIESPTATRLAIDSSGNVGIGTANPKSIFQIGKAAPANAGVKTYTGLADTDEGLLVDYYYDTNNSNLRNIDLVALGAANSSAGGSAMRFLTTPRVGGSVSPLVRMVIDNGGNVGIGTPTPDAKLAVNGTIHSKEVIVDLTGWPDYVFKPSYNLTSLKDVKTYIDQNHHLPDMPSDRQVAKDGLNLGDMNAKLLKKVEELTLYLIEKDNELKVQGNSIKEQQNRLIEQQKQIKQIKGLLKHTKQQ